jgi:hypothetical protein
MRGEQGVVVEECSGTGSKQTEAKKRNLALLQVAEILHRQLPPITAMLFLAVRTAANTVTVT